MTTYFVSKEPGASDSNPGTSSALPWLTVAKVNGSSFLGGDRILFRRGDTWRETITPPSNGFGGNHVAFSNYGTDGALPRFLGSDAQGTWTQETTLYFETMTADPVAVWFIKLDGTVQWGNMKAAKVNLAAEFDWWWDSGNSRLYVWSPTNPATRYSSVEAPSPTRDSSVLLNGKNYLTFDGLEIRYCRYAGMIDTVSTTTLTGLAVRNCQLYYIGAISTNSVPTIAYGIVSNHSATILEYNTIAEIGRRGITCHINGGATVTVDGWTAQYNTVYNCYHSAIDLQFHVTTSVCKNVTIAYNTSWLDTNRTEVTTGTPFGQLSVEGDVGAQITGVLIHHNQLRGTSDKSLSLLYTSDFSIYHNTFYGNNPNQTVSGSHISIDNHCAGTITIRNNIFYNNAVRATCVFDDVFVNGGSRITTMNNNLHFCTDSAQWIYDDFTGSTFTMAQFASYKTTTGFDTNSPTPADPIFRDGPSGNLSLTVDSPARDRGIILVGINDNFFGGAPDLGALEFILASINTGYLPAPAGMRTIGLTSQFTGSAGTLTVGPSATTEVQFIVPAKLLMANSPSWGTGDCLVVSPFVSNISSGLIWNSYASSYRTVILRLANVSASTATVASSVIWSFMGFARIS